MKTGLKVKLGIVALAGAVLAAAVHFGSSGFLASQDAEAALRGRMAMLETVGWPRLPGLAAGLMTERYGVPDRVAPGRLEWRARPPWKRIVVTDHPLSPVEQTVEYLVPMAKDAELARFPHGLRVTGGGLELSARSDREELNRLSLNLADEIARGRRTPEEAGRFYLRTVELLAAGKSSPYTERLLFSTTPDPGRIGFDPGPMR